MGLGNLFRTWKILRMLRIRGKNGVKNLMVIKRRMRTGKWDFM
jgi:hypothetical protein